MDYDALLSRAKEQLPDEGEETERFEVPQVKGHVQGQKTIINNLHQIAALLNRKPQHLLKFLQKELATPGEFIRQSAVFGSKLPASRINEKITKYVEEYVLCSSCGKPETKLSKDGGVIIMTCQACGARRALRARI